MSGDVQSQHKLQRSHMDNTRIKNLADNDVETQGWGSEIEMTNQNGDNDDE